MTQPTPTFLVHVEHEAGAFLVQTTAPETERDALVHVANEVGDRWNLDVIDVRIATPEDIAEAQGQLTHLEQDI